MPEAISQGRTIEGATANVAEALQWRRNKGGALAVRADVTVTPVTAAAA